MVSSIELEIVFKLILAAFLGGLIGYERQIHKKPAGLRTHTLICIGATLFTIVSISFVGASDPSRIASGIVTGIGFLAAGLIFRAEDHVRGLTTATELWVLAAIGIAIGIGFYYVAIVTTIIVLVILVPMKYFEEKTMKKKR